KDGSFTSILKLHMLGGGSVPIDDQVPLTLAVYQGAHLAFDPLSVSLLSRCSILDTTLVGLNSPCDSIVIYKAQLSDTTVFRMDPIALPLLVKAGGSISCFFHTVPTGKGTYTA